MYSLAQCNLRNNVTTAASESKVQLLGGRLLTFLFRQSLQPSSEHSLGHSKTDECPELDIVVLHQSFEGVDWLKDLTIKRWEGYGGGGASMSYV